MMSLTFHLKRTPQYFFDFMPKIRRKPYFCPNFCLITSKLKQFFFQITKSILKMRHLRLFAFLCLVLPNYLFTPSLYAQETGIIQSNSISFMNIYNPYLTVEYNHGFNDWFRLNTSIGVILPTDAWIVNGTDSSKNVRKHNGRGFRLALESQFILKSTGSTYLSSGKDMYYIGIETYFSKYNYISERLIANLSKQTRRYNVESDVLGVNIMFGSMFFTGQRLTMSMSAGFGIRYLNVKNDLGVPVNSLGVFYRFSDVVEPEENGRYLRYAIPFNFKIGIAIF